MNLDYAIERLYATGWTPARSSQEIETLPDGRPFPSVQAVEDEFAEVGLELSIQHNSKFHCYRATWQAKGDEAASSGTVIASCEREAAVYALAQLRSSETARAAIA